MLLMMLCEEEKIEGYFLKPHLVSACPEHDAVSVRKLANHEGNASTCSTDSSDSDW